MWTYFLCVFMLLWGGKFLYFYFLYFCDLKKTILSLNKWSCFLAKSTFVPVSDLILDFELHYHVIDLFQLHVLVFKFYTYIPYLALTPLEGASSLLTRLLNSHFKTTSWSKSIWGKQPEGLGDMNHLLIWHFSKSSDSVSLRLFNLHEKM